MTENLESIPFRVDIQRIIDVLARQIYQSPLALVRENAQNAFDAVLLRRASQPNFAGRVAITIEPQVVTVADDGVGMTSEELRRNFWSAGASGKNTPEARAAGVVGTFGIGAMANFGIAAELEVVTESFRTGERTRTKARRDTLSVTEDCITLAKEESTGAAGTTVVARMTDLAKVNVDEAERYIANLVKYVDVDVYVNGRIVSKQPIASSVPRPAAGWSHEFTNAQLTPALLASGSMVVPLSGEIWLALSDVVLGGNSLRGAFLLREGLGQFRTFRSGFGLASVAVSSDFNFGGTADSSALTPTAGREALTTESMQFLQSLVSEATAFAAISLGARQESNNNTNFMRWALRHGRIDLLANLRVRVEPDNRSVALKDVCDLGRHRPMHLYRGSDSGLIQMYTSDESYLVVGSASQPRQQCEQRYFQQFCSLPEVADQPTVRELKSPSAYSLGESALVFRLSSVLRNDYFVDISVQLGVISHQVAVLVQRDGGEPRIVLNESASNVDVLVKLYESDLTAFVSMVKDFVRSVLFPRIADLVPSSTRQGAEAFLRTINRPRDLFEYEADDLGNLSQIWADYVEGKLTLAEAAQRSSAVASTTIQTVDQSQTRSFNDVVPDVLENELRLGNDESNDASEPFPAIFRLEQEARAKVLFLEPDQPSLKGYRAFLAISERVRNEKGDFFLQPHRTSVVWGGQKAMFVFQHHSGEFGLYYELQTTRTIATESGGGVFPTATIAFRDAVFIPIPEQIEQSFIPAAGEKKRFEVRCDLLYIDDSEERASE